MKVLNSTKQEPPSPPHSIEIGLDFNLHHLASHNAIVDSSKPDFQSEMAPEESQSQMSAYQSPTPDEHSMAYREGARFYESVNGLAHSNDHDRFSSQFPPSSVPAGSLNLDLALGDFGPHGLELGDQSRALAAYPVYDEHQENLSFESKSNGPLTPASSEHDFDPRMTRSGRDNTSRRSANVAPNRPRVMRKIKKANRRGEPRKVPRLTTPLSELTKGLKDVPIRDMDAWVNRCKETRHMEVEARKGYITRPMNSFMLYRSAYAERTKIWCLQNNHQVVSSVSGESWPLETAEIREKYNELARLERSNHQEAHPGYKFSPSKAQAGSKKHVRADDAESEPSELSDLDEDWNSRSKRARNKPRPSNRSHEKEGSVTSNIYGDASMENRRVGNRSAYGYTNPGKVAPAMMDDTQQGQYYQTVVHSNVMDPNVEDLVFRKTEVPGVQYPQMRPLGLPTGNNYDVGHNYGYHPKPQRNENKLDPALAAYDNQYRVRGPVHPTAGYVESITDSGFGTPYSNLSSELEGADYFGPGHQEQSLTQNTSFHPGHQMLTDGNEWSNELQVSEFEQLMSESHINNNNGS